MSEIKPVGARNRAHSAPLPSAPPKRGKLLTGGSVDQRSTSTEALPVNPTPQDTSANTQSIGRVQIQDPRGDIALKKGVLGKITRLAMKVFGKGDKLKAKKKQAHRLNLSETSARIRDYGANARKAIGADKYTSHKENETLLQPCLQKGQMQQMRAEYEDRKTISPQTLAEAHVDLKAWEAGIEDIPTLDGKTVWHPVRGTIDETGDVQLVDNQILTTSERKLGSTDLNNAYIRINDDGTINISTGAVDNQDRAEELIAVMAKAIEMWEAKNEERPDGQKWERPQLRLSMHQLNAFGVVGIGEASMIKRQHKMVAYIENNLRQRLQENDVNPAWIPKGPVVAQLNRTFNGFTQLPGENGKCHEVNRYGLAVQTHWMQEDMNSQGLLAQVEEVDANRQAYSDAQEAVNSSGVALIGLRSRLSHLETVVTTEEEITEVMHSISQLNDKIDATLKEIRELPEDASVEQRETLVARRKQLTNAKTAASERLKELQPVSKETKAEMKQLRKDIAAQEKLLGRQLQTLSTAMTSLAETIGDASPEAHTRLHLMGKLLATQTGMDDSLSSAQQLQLMFLVDELNTAVTQSNCKSGLDRNGLARAFKSALRAEIDERTAGEKSLSQAVEEVSELVLNFDSRVQEMDQAWRTHKKTNPNDSFHQWLGDKGKEFQAVANYQTRVFAALMGEGRPITHFSTGTSGGFKWHHSKKSINPLEKNPHPVPYIPVEVVEDEQVISLVTADANGKRSFTPEGELILEGQSQRRGG